jgi:uncharacterized protein
MLHVNAYIARSSIHGRGLFSGEDIPAGRTIWSFNAKCDLVVPHWQFSSLADRPRGLIQHFGYFNSSIKCFILSVDGANFINHSEEPNVITITLTGYTEGIDIAAFDIARGEELTMDYRQFDADFRRKLGLSGSEDCNWFSDIAY